MLHGFMMGVFSGAGGYAINNYGQELGRAGKIASSAVLGGVVSEIGGGKFANGAITAAYSMMFNEMMHGGFTKKYSNRAQAYNDMIEYSNKKNVEVGAYYIEGNGTIVLYSSENTKLFCKHPKVYKDACGKYYIKHGGKAYYIVGEVHTHIIDAWGSRGNRIRVSSQDETIAWKYFNGAINILDSQNGDLYKFHLANGKDKFQIIPKSRWDR